MTHITLLLLTPHLHPAADCPEQPWISSKCNVKRWNSRQGKKPTPSLLCKLEKALLAADASSCPSTWHRNTNSSSVPRADLTTTATCSCSPPYLNPSGRRGPIPDIHTPSRAAWLHAHLTPQHNPEQPAVQNSPPPVFQTRTDFSACPELIFHTNKGLEETPQPSPTA